MFVPKIPLIACFGDEEDPRTWVSEKPVIAIDDEGVPWVVSTKAGRALVPATQFSNYRSLRQVNDDHASEVIAAHAGWRAIYACSCHVDGGGVEVELTVLPIAAWKRGEGASLIPLVPNSVDYGISEGSARGRAMIDDPLEHSAEHLIAIFGPGEELPPNNVLMEVATEELAKREGARPPPAQRSQQSEKTLS